MSIDFNILVVDDDKDLRESLGMLLEIEGYSVDLAINGLEAFELYATIKHDLVITDIVMEKVDGISLLKNLKEFDSEAIIVLMTGYSSIKGAVEAIKLGAEDYFIKPFDAIEVKKTVKRIYKNKELQDEASLLKQTILKKEFPEIIGQSSAIRKVLDNIKSVAEADINILITGESGSGKELVSQAIHQKSKRSNEAFIPINCAAIPKDLLESELFGHEKGAFSGAMSKKYGLFEMANKGTLFLDEIGEMPVELQAKLLRVVESKQLRRIGGTQLIDVDFRIICSTNRDIKNEIESGNFREDLYFRLNGFNIHVPPLRDRKEDIQLLLDNFLKKSVFREIQFSEQIIVALMMYEWPGNIREFENVISRTLILSKNKPPSINHLPMEIQTIYKNKNHINDSDGLKTIKTLEQVEKDHISKVYKLYNRNKAITAKHLNISLKTLYRKLEKFSIG